MILIFKLNGGGNDGTFWNHSWRAGSGVLISLFVKTDDVNLLFDCYVHFLFCKMERETVI